MGRGQLVAVIVGAGQAGARAAKAMRVAGFEGRIRMFGAEPHLPYERPLLSKAFLKDPATAVPYVLPPESYEDLSIEVETSRTVVGIDRNAQRIGLEDGAEVHYDMLLLATGSKLRPLAIAGYPARDILALRTLDDSLAIEGRLAGRPAVIVVGGGFIGLEVAASMAGRGCRVTVVEMADRLLPRLGCPEASAMVLAHHRALGIDVRLGARISGGEPGFITLADGDRLEATFIVAGVGVAPETSLADQAGIVADDGILVDEYGRTNDPAIFAAGDVTRHFSPLAASHIRLESWQNANLQAEAVGRTMAGEPTAYSEVPWLWSDQGDLNLQMAGFPAAVDATIVRGDPGSEEGIAVFQFFDRRLVGGLTVNRGKEMPLIRRMLADPNLSFSTDDLADAAIPLRKILSSKVA